MTKEQKEIYRFVNRVLDSIVDIHNMRYKHLEKNGMKLTTVLQILKKMKKRN